MTPHTEAHTTTTTSWWCEHAWINDQAIADVRIEADDSGVITAVVTGCQPSPNDQRLHGLVFPGFANAHSHAFHRALRGRTHGDGGTFWTWREVMYRVAKNLNPDNYYRLARAAFAEMVLAGVTCVGEFHYVHHNVDGTPYNEPNAMAHALTQAAADAGLRITLLDTAYLAGGLASEGHTELSAEQKRFADRDVEAWASRWSAFDDNHQWTPGGVLAGAAIHSLRAVPRDQLKLVTEARPNAPVHVHLSEQIKENESMLAHYGVTPTQLLADTGALSPRLTAVHATHLTAEDIRLLGEANAGSCFCPTTERDLADGIGPARALHDAGSMLSVGSDQHAVVDMFEDVRALEMHERLTTYQRGRFAPRELVSVITTNGHQAMGWSGAGRLNVGAPADLVAVSLSSVRTAGSLPDQVLYAATAADVTDVVCGGRRVVAESTHSAVDVAGELADSIREVVADG